LHLLAGVLTLVMTGQPGWAQTGCEGPDPPECEIDCDSDDWAPEASPLAGGCVNPEDIPDPPKPRCPTDRFFVYEPQSYSCDGWGDPLVRTVPVTRYVGPTNESATYSRLIDWADYVTKGRLGVYATLSIMAYDVDRKASACFPATVNTVRFNNIPVWFMHPTNQHGRLSGANRWWAVTQFKIPIKYVNFPSAPGTGNNPPGAWANYVSIDVPDPCRCIAIGWISLRIEATSPVALVPGAEQTRDFWDEEEFIAIDDYLRDERFVVIDDISHQDPSVVKASENLKRALDERRVRYGVDSLHVIAHSKGGLDSLRLLARERKNTDQFQILSLTTLGSPLRGSVLADLVEARKKALFARFYNISGWTQDILTFAGFFVGGTAHLTTWWTADFMEEHVPLLPRDGIEYQTVSADLDLNDDTHASCSPTEEFYEIRQFVPLFNILSCSVGQPIADSIYRTVRYKRTVAYVWFFLWVWVEGVDTTSDEGNDILVSIRSAWGPSAYRDRVSSEIIYNYPYGKNHASIADEEVGADVVGLIMQAEQQWGDMNPRLTGQCYP
jgi:hypothetical protein